jgi:hypothetical protein
VFTSTVVSDSVCSNRLDAVLVEERRDGVVVVHAGREAGHQAGDELEHAGVVTGGVDRQTVDVGREEVAHGAQDDVEPRRRSSRCGSRGA